MRYPITQRGRLIVSTSDECNDGTNCNTIDNGADESGQDNIEGTSLIRKLARLFVIHARERIREVIQQNGENVLFEGLGIEAGVGILQPERRNQIKKSM